VLFTVSVAANAKYQLPVAARAAAISDVLLDILTAKYDPLTSRGVVDRHSGGNVLTIVDAQHRDPLPVVTITNADAQAHRTNADVLAGNGRKRCRQRSRMRCSFASPLHAIVTSKKRSSSGS
jgi:hypothetical protein